MVSSDLDPTTTLGASGLVGGSYIGDAAITDHKKLAPTGFLLSLLLQYPSPGLGTLTFISCGVKSRWVATPPKSKGTHNDRAGCSELRQLGQRHG